MKPKTQDVKPGGVKFDPPPTEKARTKARETTRGQVLSYYMGVTGKIPSEQVIHEDGKLTYWWLEPEIPGMDNPVVVEGEQGGQWFIRVDTKPATIRVFIP